MIKINIFLLILLIAFQINISAQQVGGINELDGLVNETIQNNSQLRAARGQTDAQKTKVDQVTAWEAPQVGISFYQTPIQSFPNPLKDGMETDYFIQQMIPFPGKLSNMGKSAEDNAGMYNQQYREMEKSIIKELKSDYYELYYIQRKIGINRENQDLLKQISEITARQYEVGMGKQTDMLRAQTELSTLINDSISLGLEKRNVETMLNTILNRRPDGTFGEITTIEDTIPDWNYEQLSNLAFENRPDIKAMDFNIKMNEAELNASELEYYPDIMIQLMYKNMTGTTKDFWSTMVGVNIPIAFWSKDKYSGKIEENKINISTAEEQLNGAKNMAASQIQNALLQIESNKNLLRLYKNTVIPQSQQTLQSTLSEYQTGKTEFLMIIDAYKMVLMAKQDYYMAQMNYMQSQAQLEEAVGLSKKEILEKLKD